MPSHEQLAMTYAYERARELVEGVGHYTAQPDWYDISGPDGGDFEPILEAVDYLESRGLLERHTENPNVVQVKEVPSEEALATVEWSTRLDELDQVHTMYAMGYRADFSRPGVAHVPGSPDSTQVVGLRKAVLLEAILKGFVTGKLSQPKP